MLIAIGIAIFCGYLLGRSSIEMPEAKVLISGVFERARAFALRGGAVQNVRDVSWRAAFGLCEGRAGGAGHGYSGGYSLGRKLRAAGRDAQRQRGFSAVIPG